jgi:hypothetical protein
MRELPMPQNPPSDKQIQLNKFLESKPIVMLSSSKKISYEPMGVAAKSRQAQKNTVKKISKR